MTALEHAPMRLAALARRLRQVMRGLALSAVVLAGFAAVLAALVLQALAPAPGDWSTTLRWATPVGTVERRLSVPVLLRWATHPLAARLLDGREWHTRTGIWHLHVGAAGEIRGDCQPCVLQLEALGSGPLHITQASWQVSRRRVAPRRLTTRLAGGAGTPVPGAHTQRASPEHWQGSLRLGEAGRMLNLAWHAQLHSEGLEIHAELPPTPMADALALFAETVPEARRARVDGSLALNLDARWGPQGLHLVRLAPRLDGVRVQGLGTEALIDAVAPAACTAPARGRVDGWLPKAVVAALDPRFYEHVDDELDLGLDLGLPGGPPRRERSLTGQLARLLYTGDGRSLPQALREWLYAVEMERTLGKGRILQTYLALAPWGTGVCGAEAAARHYLGKPAERLTPREAAWLASRLRH